MNIYISDLDGTLLNEDGKLSVNSKKLINNAIDNNINFSIATARTPATVNKLMEGVNINLPIVVMNGAATYDMKKNKYISFNPINIDLARKIQKIITDNKLNAFIYSIKNNHLYVYHNALTNAYQEEFLKARINTPYKTFVKGNFDNNTNVLYFTLVDYKDNVEFLYNKIKNIDGIYIAKYMDIYNPDCYNLEIYDIKSSKANAIKYLEDTYNYSRLITFGDNINDVPMFEISDECYAVGNAVNELKEIATDVLDSNSDDAVAAYIELCASNQN